METTEAAAAGSEIERPPGPSPSPAGSISDANSAYERWEFPSPESAGTNTLSGGDATDAAAEATQEAPAARAAEPQPPIDELPDDELDRLLKHPRAKERVDELVNNRFGNRLQLERVQAERAARQRLATEQAAWEEASQTYNRLMADDDYYAAMVRENGEEEVLSFRANFQRAAKARAAASAQPSFNQRAYQQQFAQAFNDGAIGEFKAAVREAIPFYAELPDETRTRIESAAYDPQGNWFADSLGALGKGVQSYVDGLRRRHEGALREAIEAGKNDALAEREERAPVVVSGSPGDLRSWPEIELAYAEGRLPRPDWLRLKAAHGKTM